jgi:hypothetical protein
LDDRFPVSARFPLRHWLQSVVFFTWDHGIGNEIFSCWTWFIDFVSHFSHSFLHMNWLGFACVMIDQITVVFLSGFRNWQSPLKAERSLVWVSNAILFETLRLLSSHLLFTRLSSDKAEQLLICNYWMWMIAVWKIHLFIQ